MNREVSKSMKTNPNPRPETQNAGYTDEQTAAINAVNATLTAVNLPTYTSLEDKLYQALTACTESIDLGKRLYQELVKKGASK